MQSLVKISQQTLWQILGKVVTAFSTFIILGLVTRNYGEEGTGVFTLALTYLAIFYLLADFGFNAHVLKQISAKNLHVGGVWQKLLGTRILWSGVLVIFALVTLPLWPFATSLFSQAVLFGSLAIVASSIYTTCNLIFQSKLRYDLSALASSLGTVVGLAVFVYLIFLNLPVPHLIFGHLISWVIISLVALLLVYRVIKVLLPRFDIQYTQNLFKATWPIAATLGLNVIYFRADSFLIAFFRSSAEVGIYNVAFSIFQTALVLPTFIMNAYYPMMLKSLAGFKLVGVGLFILAAGGSILTIILAPFLTQVLTGGGFLGAKESLQILSLGFPAYFLSSFLMWMLVTKGKYRQMVIIYGIGLMTNLFLNFIFIPQYSFIAASLITVISEYLILALQLFILYFRR